MNPPSTAVQPVRIWDLPTRLFHWTLTVAVVAMVVLAQIGGDAMNWHFRVGYLIFALLLFRLMWGVVGGHWSRFASFWPTPGRVLGYLRGHGSPDDYPGHNPLGALSVLAMLIALGLQAASGLCADDEIAYAGPLAARASSAVVDLATRYHTTIGKILVLGLVALHVLAIIRYQRRGHKLVRPMILGDRMMQAGVASSRDGTGQRVLATVLLAVAGAVVYAVVQWGKAAPSFG